MITVIELEPTGMDAQKHVSVLQVFQKLRLANSQYILNIANKKLAKHALTVEYAIEYFNT